MSLKSQRDYWLIFRYIIWISVFLLFLLLFFLWRIDNYRVERFRLAILNYTIPNVEFFSSSVKLSRSIARSISPQVTIRSFTFAVTRLISISSPKAALERIARFQTMLKKNLKELFILLPMDYNL